MTERYIWTDFEPATAMSGDGSGDPDMHFISITNDEGDEFALICHRTVDGEYPLDGAVAEQKRRNAEKIVDALNRSN